MKFDGNDVKYVPIVIEYITGFARSVKLTQRENRTFDRSVKASNVLTEVLACSNKVPLDITIS